ncbi:MAG: hypothetical protein V3T33_04080 [Myxococcota bacterium]
MSQTPERYAVQLLCDPDFGKDFISYPGGKLSWEQVHLATAAEVGEPEGVRTVVFDFVTRTAAGDYEVFRCDAEPGEAASALARTSQKALGEARCSPSLHSLAKEGRPSRWYPDLTSFERGNLSYLDKILGGPSA